MDALLIAVAVVAAVAGSLWIARRRRDPRETLAVPPVPREAGARPARTIASSKTLSFSPHTEAPWWRMDSVRGEPAMQVMGRWQATNLTEREICLTAARLDHPATPGRVGASRQSAAGPGRPAVPPGGAVTVSAQFLVQPPACGRGEDFRATVMLIDQFGDEHRIADVLFAAG